MINQNKPPLTDRGVQNTLSPILLEKNILVDWLEFTIRDNVNPLVILTDYLHINKFDIIKEEVGLYCYNITFSWRDIKVLVNKDRPQFGIHILMSGRGCRDFESLGFEWLDFFKFLLDNFDIHFSRIDIAIDSYNDKYYTLQKLRDYINNGQVVSRFKSSTEFMQKKLSDSTLESETIWFGSRTSNIQIVFYNKLYEQLNTNYELNEEFRDKIKSWYRCETRFRNEQASTLIECFVSNNNYMNVINQVLFNYLDFKDFSATETNKSRWNTSSWWLDFLDTNTKLSLKVNKKLSNITRKKKWLEDSVSKSELMVYLSDISKDNDFSLDNYTLNHLYDLLKKGFIKIQSKDLLMINEYRIEKGLIPLKDSDLIDLLNSVSKLVL